MPTFIPNCLTMKVSRQSGLNRRPADYKVCVNGELAWDDLGFREYSADILRFAGALDDKMLQSQFYVFLAVGKLLFGRRETSQAMHFAPSMVGANPLVAKEAPSFRDLYFKFS
jgi:hypothetical protein